jgi:cobalt-zinc-cadmium efflux system outer membrane protein
MRMMILVPLLAAMPGAALAEPLSFDEALARATNSAPLLEARGEQIRARQSAAIAAGQLPDPKLGIGLDNFPVSGQPAFSLTRENMTMERVGIEQEVPNLAKRHAQQNRAEADIAAARARSDADLRRIRVATALAWIDAYYARKRLQAMDTILERLRRLPGAAVSAVAAGTGRPAQSLNIRQSIAELFEDRRSVLVAEAGKARAELARWTGDPDAQPSGPLPHFEVSREELRASLARHPELVMAAASVGQALANVDAARAETRPDWGFNVAFQRRDPQFGNMVSVGATMTLPLFPGKRQNPRIDAARADAAAARAEKEDIRRTLEAQLEAALAEHAMHHEQWMRARDTLLPLAQREAQLETASYAAGRAGLLDVIEAEAGLARTEIDMLDREAAVARHEALLALTYGDNR